MSGGQGYQDRFLSERTQDLSKRRLEKKLLILNLLSDKTQFLLVSNYFSCFKS